MNKWSDFRVERTKTILKYYAARKEILKVTNIAKLLRCHFVL